MCFLSPCYHIYYFSFQHDSRTNQHALSNLVKPNLRRETPEVVSTFHLHRQRKRQTEEGLEAVVLGPAAPEAPEAAPHPKVPLA